MSKMYDVELACLALSMRPGVVTSGEYAAWPYQPMIQTYARTDEQSVLAMIESLVRQGLNPATLVVYLKREVN